MITILFHSKANPLTFHSGPYGDIAYAKSWCGFENPRRITALYRKWREGVKAYITQRSWDPTNLTDAQFASVLDFAHSLSPRSARLKDVTAITGNPTLASSNVPLRSWSSTWPRNF